MKQPLRVQFHGMEPSPALEAQARDHTAKLEQFASDIVACRVGIALEQKHQQQGRPFTVTIDLTLSGQELVVSHVHHEDAYLALRDAFEKMRRQLEDTVHKRHGEVKHHAVPLHGEIVRLDSEGGFGFIRTASGDEYYFNRDNVNGTPFDHVQLGSAVQFLPEDGKPGPQAKRVSLGKHGYR